MDRSLLSSFERFSVGVLEWMHSKPTLRRIMHACFGSFTTRWVRYSTQMLWQVEGFENIAELKAPRGLIVVTNHRSFFDMYIFGALIDQRTRLMLRACFPVRANFFYNRPLGFLMNVFVAGGAMWPPIFREKHRRSLNRTAFVQVGETLTEGSLVGVHPEGRRNPGDDPYEFLPLKPGLGHLVAECHEDTLILPGFVAGLTNKIGYETTRGWRHGKPRGVPIRLWVGEPIRVGDLGATHDNAAETTAAVFQRVRDMAARDQAASEAWADLER